MRNWDESLLEIDFLNEEEPVIAEIKGTYKIVIADDDEEVHTITKMMLRDFELQGRTLEFIDTYSGEETKKALGENNDIAVLLLDVVMEQKDSGLRVIEYLREELNNQMTRIVLRTGQPGEAPEEEVIKNYDINDYRLKTEMTFKRLYTTVYTALRGYRDLKQIDNHRKGLEKIIKASSRLFEHNTLNEFLTSILSNLSSFYVDSPEMIYIRQSNINNGFVTMEKENEHVVVAATGKYEKYIGEKVEAIEELVSIFSKTKEKSPVDEKIEFLERGFIINNSSKDQWNNFIYIEGKKESYDFELINLFLATYSVALDNYILNNMISTTQKEIIITLSEVVESHFDDTAGHVRRLSEMMYKFGVVLNFSYAECELLKVASTMHDIGKIGIPDNILKKKGRLTDEEFEQIKQHPMIGSKILGKSDLELLKMSAELALNHHEKYDGSGYPKGLVGQDIPLSSRMLAIVDVFDAMSHKRVYKDAASREEVIKYIIMGKGMHFDPKLVDTFLENIEEIVMY